MSKYIQSSDTQPLRTLYQYVEAGDLALPDFQRNLVWNAKDAHALLVSLANDNPAGSLLALQNGGSSFQPRAIAEAPPIKDNPPYLLLDGQQRMTTLYQALSGKGDSVFFVDLRRLEATGDLEEALFFVSASATRGRAKKLRERYASFDGQVEDLVFPMSQLFSTDGMGGWIKSVRRRTKDDELEDRLDSLQKRWFQPIVEYQFPLVVLKPDTPPEAVCNMFEELNKRGIRLSVFDLLVARFWTQDVLLRERWSTTLSESAEIARFGIDPYYLLQAISLVVSYEKSKARGGTVADCKKGTVLGLQAEEVDAWWDVIDDATEWALNLLGDDCGILAPKWLPYDPIVIPLAAVVAHQKKRTGKFPEGQDRLRLKRWFWCSVFGRAYDQGANSQAAKDFVELCRWLGGGEEPSTVREFAFDEDDLDRVGPRQTGLYRGVIALVMSNPDTPRDFREFGPVARSIWANQADDHHIFPYAYLRDTLKVTEEAKRNVVINRTLIDGTTNKKISKKAPASYFGDLCDEHCAGNRDDMDEFLGSHLIPGGPASPIWANEYERFLAERKQLIAERVRAVTS